jgi:hypothetical protein
MTYDFDTERWFDMERAALEKDFRKGALDRNAYHAALDNLQRKLEALWDRLDGSYQIPK